MANPTELGIEYSVALVASSAFSLIIAVAVYLVGVSKRRRRDVDGTRRPSLRINAEEYEVNVSVIYQREEVISEENTSAAILGASHVFTSYKRAIDGLLTATLVAHGILQLRDLESQQDGEELPEPIFETACYLNTLANLLFNMSNLYPAFCEATLCLVTFELLRYRMDNKSRQKFCLVSALVSSVSLVVAYIVSIKAGSTFPAIHLALLSSYAGLLLTPLLRITLYLRHRNKVLNAAVQFSGSTRRLNNTKIRLLAVTAADYFCLLPNAVLTFTVMASKSALENELFQPLDSAPSLLVSCATPIVGLPPGGALKDNLLSGFRILAVTGAICTGSQLFFYVFLASRFGRSFASSDVASTSNATLCPKDWNNATSQCWNRTTTISHYPLTTPFCCVTSCFVYESIEQNVVDSDLSLPIVENRTEHEKCLN